MPSITIFATALTAFTTIVLAFDNARITYYQGQDLTNMQLGACEQPAGSLAAQYGAAMSLADNGNKQACGQCINVHYHGKSVKLQVLHAERNRESRSTA